MKIVKINVIRYLNLMVHAPSPLISLKPSLVVEELTRKKCERKRMKQIVELSGWIGHGRKWVGEDTITKEEEMVEVWKKSSKWWRTRIEESTIF